jgi:hypothetical protein
MTKSEKLALIENLLLQEDPKMSKAILYAKMYGTLSAYVSDETLDAIIENKTNKK